MISIQKRARGMWWTDVTVVMMMGGSWCSYPCVIPCPWVQRTVGFSSNTRMSYRQWDACDYMSVTTSHEVAPPGLLGDMLPSGFEEAAAVLWAVTCRGPSRKEGGFWLTTSKKRPISPTPHQELSVASEPCELGGGSFSRGASDETGGHSRPLHWGLVRAWAKEPVRCADPWATKPGKINVCCLTTKYASMVIQQEIITQREKISNWKALKGGNTKQ